MILILGNLLFKANAPSAHEFNYCIEERYGNFMITESLKQLHFDISSEVRAEDTKMLNYLFNNTDFKDQDNQLKLKEISDELSINPLWILRVIYKESRGNPKAVNSFTNATGLIQWLPNTARHLGTSVLSIYNMSVIEQLDLFKKFIYNTGKLHAINTYEDLYMSVFLPSAVGKHNTYVLGRKNSKIVKYNIGVDSNKDGIITVKDFKQYANKF